MAVPDTSDQAIAPLSRLPRRRGRRLRILLWTVCILVVLLLVSAGTGVLWLRDITRAALPQLDGTLHLPGLTAPVTVRRDAHGVPHIGAATQRDLFFAQGYVTAQDRLWQMDVLRRNANGNLASILGPRLVRHDVARRVLRIRHTAWRIYASLPPAERTRLDDYAQGVNLYIAQHSKTLPPEFRLLHYRPAIWTGADSISIGLLMVQTLDTHWPTKLARARISAKLHNPALESSLYPVGSSRDHPPAGIEPGPNQLGPSQPQHKSSSRTSRETSTLSYIGTRAIAQAVPGPSENLTALRRLLDLPTCAGCASGSNNWAIAGSHTASGKPLLSNDMHLGLTVPNIWYMADLRAPGYHAAGVTLPGMPYIVAGHNDHVAWGFTALYADVQDLYVEKLDGKGHYLAADGTWKTLRVDREHIRVRGGKDVTINVRLTDHGPLLNPLLINEKQPIALKWTLYDPNLHAIPLYELNIASNWEQFSAALRQWDWPTQNVIYADDQGHIAYHAIGRVPLRPGGLMGVPIRDNAHEWHGYIPFRDLPGAFDPPDGLLATANSRVTPRNTPYPITLEWADPYRIERIYNVLQGRQELRPQDMLALQTDIYSEVDQELARRFAYAIDHTPGASQRLRDAADLMRHWDGRLTIDSPAASLVTKTRKALWPMILDPKLGKDARLYHWEESNYAEEEIILHAQPEWLPPGYKNWDQLLADAVRRGMKQGNAPDDINLWTYGSWHVIDLEHPLARLLPFVSRYAGTGPHPLSGDTTTVKQVGRAFGPSQRFTMDWSNIDHSTENIVLGESGNPLSPYFRDQWNAWYEGKTFALPFTRAAVVAQTHHTLHLLP